MRVSDQETAPPIAVIPFGRCCRSNLRSFQRPCPGRGRTALDVPAFPRKAGREQVLKAADHADVKMAKVYAKGNNVWVSVETFAADPLDSEGIFNRASSAIKTGTDQFVSRMK